MNSDKKLPCDDKLAFNSESDANAEASKLEWYRGIKLKAYKCRYCSLWHLSSQS